MRDSNDKRPLLRSFFMGGFECSTHINERGRRLDLIDSTRHDEFAERDYVRLLEHGIAAARDGVRWHLIEREPYRYDFSSLERQIQAVKKTGIQVIWDYFHYGFPDGLDIYSPEFVERFAGFSSAVTRFLQEELKEDPFVCPVNEISFFSWAAGDRGNFYPHSRRRGHMLKRQLVRAAIASVDAVRSAAPNARWIFSDPAIHVVTRGTTTAAKRAAERYRRAQFEAYDMLAGRKDPDLGGHPRYIDIVGLNYYFHSQWFHPSRRKLPLGHKLYRPLNEILREYYLRYGRPVMIAETGIEDDERPSWFRYVCEQSRIAMKHGVPLIGLCLYPICNHPGWADNRHCHNGLWDYADESGGREIHQPLSDEIHRQRNAFDSAEAAVKGAQNAC